MSYVTYDDFPNTHCNRKVIEVNFIEGKQTSYLYNESPIMKSDNNNSK